MPIFRMTKGEISALPSTSFAQSGLQERGDLQRLLRSNIDVVAPGVLVIAEEFADWEESRRRIDLLGVDHTGKLVVIELKRTEDGGHMELQAVRYAAMVASMTFEQAVDVFQSSLSRWREEGQDARARLLAFLDWDEPHEEDFAQDVRLVLVAADFSRELTTAVLWLNEQGLDIQCIRLKPYDGGDAVLVDAQRIIPLPEAGDYQERVKHKTLEVREARREETGYWFMNTGETKVDPDRSWEDERRYGFMLAGGGERYTKQIRKLRVGDKLFAFLSGHGYVGLGEVTAEAVPLRDFVPIGQTDPLPDLPLTAELRPERLNDPEQWDLCVAVRWVKAVPRENAVLRDRHHLGTLSRIKQPDLVAELLRHFGNG